ncbi:MAG: hypothetical protein JWM80_4570 [Cyanobacteria bacterium RYN_339]|nr:hypothetical protein [Cyanobacteria bacterium RYN_339]
MPKSKTRKTSAAQPERPILADDDAPRPRNRFQAIAGAAIALLIVLSMVISVFLPFLNWR